MTAVINKWKWVLAAMVVAALLAIGYSLLAPPTYRTGALVAITETRERVQFDPRFQAVDEQQPFRAYPELAKSDDLLRALREQPSASAKTLAELRRDLEAEAGSDPSLMRLTVSDRDPRTAAAIANDWARLFVSYANEVYGSTGEERLQSFAEQLEAAEEGLARAEEALVDFQSRSRLAIAQNELTAHLQTQSALLEGFRDLTALIQNTTLLRDQLGRQDNDEALLADQLTILALQLNAFGSQTPGTTTNPEIIVRGKREGLLPLQLQIGAGSEFADADRESQMATLENLSTSLDSMIATIAGDLEELQPQILGLQREVESLAAEENRLTRNRDVADETYLALSRKVQEERITSQEAIGGVRLASTAAVPGRPSGPSTLILAVAAMVLGAFIMSLAIVLITWWQRQAAR